MITDFSSIIAPGAAARVGFGRAEADRVAGPDELLADAEAAVIQSTSCQRRPTTSPR
jgi:hypothetical protein